MAEAASLRTAVRLREGRDRPLHQGHPWILSGSVATVEGDPQRGEPVRILDACGAELGIGDFDPDSQIRVRVIAFGPHRWDAEEPWLPDRLEAALDWRQDHPALRGCDALRLVNSEGDALPGLIVDRYAEWLAVKPTTPGMERRLPRVAALLEELTGATGAWLRGGESEDRALFGEVPAEPLEIHEHGRRYRIDLRHGQKTGFYLDQRGARDRYASLATGRRCLDLFAYTGGFTVAAQLSGARDVVAVESSPAAHALLTQNAPRAEIVLGDVSEFLRKEERHFDLIALDPPPLARRKRDVPRAARAYKDLLLHTLRRAAPGAYLLAFSCSHHVGPELFRKIAQGAAQDAGTRLQVIETLGAAPDHPVALAHPQGAYLCGLVLRVLAPAAG
ncbi:MAG: class I SAM-dependent rRNA methyltransferase [Myxococcota bacterium]